MAFARKREHIQSLGPDLLILQECSEKDILETDAPFRHWVGTNKNKGLGIIGYTSHDYHIDPLYTDDLPWFIPITITDLNINILAVWAHVKTQQLRYVRLIHEAVNRYEQFLTASPSIITGDLNSSTAFDKKHGARSHTALVKKLQELGIESAYHSTNNEIHGQEKDPTWYMYRHLDKGYHLDYAFVSSPLIKTIHVEIGKPDVWLEHSDHMPLVLDVASHVG